MGGITCGEKNVRAREKEEQIRQARGDFCMVLWHGHATRARRGGSGSADGARGRGIEQQGLPRVNLAGRGVGTA